MRRLLMCAAIMLLASGVPRANTDPPPRAPNVAAFQKTASTNFPGWRIEVHADGSVLQTVVLSGNRRNNPIGGNHLLRKLDKTLAARFVKEVQQAMPLTQYKAGNCPKSASFGTQLLLQCGGQQSPDLSCGPIDKKLQASLKDARALEKLCDLKE